MHDTRSYRIAVLSLVLSTVLLPLIGIQIYLQYVALDKAQQETVASQLLSPRVLLVLWAVAAAVMCGAFGYGLVRLAPLGWRRLCAGFRHWVDVLAARREIAATRTSAPWLWLSGAAVGEVTSVEYTNKAEQAMRTLFFPLWRQAKVVRDVEVSVLLPPGPPPAACRAGMEVRSEGKRVCELNVGTNGVVWYRYPGEEAQKATMTVTPHRWNTLRFRRLGASAWAIDVNGTRMRPSGIVSGDEDCADPLDVKLTASGPDTVSTQAVFSRPEVR
ncbi:MAG: hypothetical protein KKI08_16340 [Armatimonadetes bacterium]|nr:hypothetical protein [Armatimonadota bacterium]